MKNCRILEFKSRNLLAVLVAQMSGKSFVVDGKTSLTECLEETIPADDNALYKIKFEETGDQTMHSNNYLDEENGNTKPDPNEHKNIENDCFVRLIILIIKTKKNYAETLVFEREKIKHLE